jgi:hypothetical protein
MNRWRIIRWLIVGVVALTGFETARMVLPCTPRCRFPLRNEAVRSRLCGDAPAFSADGRLFATIVNGDDPLSMGINIHLWDCINGCLLGDLRHGDKKFENVAVSADGQRVAAVSRAGICVVWDVTTRAELTHVKLDCESLWDPFVVFGPDGRPIVADSNSCESYLTLWNGATGRKLVTPEPKGFIVFKKGTVIGLWSRQTACLNLYDVADEHHLACLSERDVRPRESDDSCADYAPLTGTLAYVRPAQQDLTVLNATSDRALVIPLGERLCKSPTVQLSPDGRRAAVGPFVARPDDRSMMSQSALDHLPDGVADRLQDYLADTSEVVVYDTSNGRERARLPGQWALFAPDGKTLIVVAEAHPADPNRGWDYTANVYDWPLRGPRTFSLAFGFFCGVAALLVTRRLVRRTTPAQAVRLPTGS